MPQVVRRLPPMSKLRTLFPIAIVLWLAFLATGFYWLMVYESTPGQAAANLKKWPQESSITPATNLPTLLMFVHPQCPCSRASIAELTTIMTRVQGQVDAHVLFIKPTEFGIDWEKSDIWYSVIAIPGVKVSVDINGTEAKKFGSKSSGQTFLFAPNGNLLFNGGITASRGHIGDNEGQQAVVSLIQQGTSINTVTAVFGCDLSIADKPKDCDVRGKK